MCSLMINSFPDYTINLLHQQQSKVNVDLYSASSQTACSHTSALISV